MAPYARWVLESFKHILVDSCDEYFDTNDRGNDKSRSKLITRVANDIAAIAQDKNQRVPDDLEKVTFYLSPTLNINVNICSVSAYGLVTMREVMPRNRGRKSQRSTPVAIQHHQRRGRLSLFLVISLQNAFPTSNGSFPTTVTKKSENIVPLWRMFLTNLPKRKSSDVRTLP